MLALLAIAVAASVPAVAQSPTTASDPTVDVYLDALRADFRADKIVLVTEAMRFNDKEAAAFWPVYKRYEAELVKLTDERVRVIRSYAEAFATLTDADARSLALQALALESRRTDLRKKYFDEFSKVLPGLIVAKFFQLEYRLDLLVNLKLASELPSLLVRSAETQTGATRANPN